MDVLDFVVLTVIEFHKINLCHILDEQSVNSNPVHTVLITKSINKL